jgi:hypothetical protein
MSFKGNKQPLTHDELFVKLGELDVGDTAALAATETQQKPDQDLLQSVDELEILVSQRPASRPSTPRPSSSPKRTFTATPPPGRSSEDKPVSRESGDSQRPFHTSLTPAATTPSEVESAPESSKVQSKSGGGSWWGGLVATASAAVRQAEAAVKEIQKNEEAQKWAEQVRGNVGALRGLGIYPALLSWGIHILKLYRVMSRGRTTDAGTSNVHFSYPHSGSSDLFPRAPSNPHYTRSLRVSFP